VDSPLGRRESARAYHHRPARRLAPPLSAAAGKPVDRHWPRLQFVPTARIPVRAPPRLAASERADERVHPPPTWPSPSRPPPSHRTFRWVPRPVTALESVADNSNSAGRTAHTVGRRRGAAR
jgi:hypothetical protein